MNITSANSVYVNRNQNSTFTKPGFKSIVPVKVFVDGKPSMDYALNRKAIRQISDFLFKKAESDEVQRMKDIFASFVKDYKDPKGLGEKGKIIRNYHSEKYCFLFTGDHAEHLDNVARNIGPAKHNALSTSSKSNKEIAEATKSRYYEAQSQYFNPEHSGRLKFNGSDIGLNIFAKTRGTKGKKGYGLDLKFIGFRMIDEPIPHSEKPPAQITLFG